MAGFQCSKIIERQLAKRWAFSKGSCLAEIEPLLLAVDHYAESSRRRLPNKSSVGAYDPAGQLIGGTVAGCEFLSYP